MAKKKPEFHILEALADGHYRNGYEIIKKIEADKAVQISVGTLYGAIKRLLEAGLIEGKQDYKITDLGYKALERNRL